MLSYLFKFLGCVQNIWRVRNYQICRFCLTLHLFFYMYKQYRRRKWQPTLVLLPGESQGRGSLVGCCLWGCTESDTTKATQQQQQGFLFLYRIHSPDPSFFTFSEFILLSPGRSIQQELLACIGSENFPCVFLFPVSHDILRLSTY